MPLRDFPRGFKEKNQGRIGGEQGFAPRRFVSETKIKERKGIARESKWT